MSVYLTMIFLTLLFSVFAMEYSTVTGTDIKKRVPAKFFIFLILTVWCSIYALRYYVGTDFGAYYYSFNRILNDNVSFSSFIADQRDSLFAYIQFFTSSLSGGKWLVFSYLCAALTYIPVIIVISKKSTDFTASILLYIFTYGYFSGFNGTRQAIAVAFIFLAYYLGLKEKKYWLYAILVLVAFGFHSTVFIAVPFQLISMMSIKSKTFKITVTVLLLSYLFLWNIWSIVIDFLESIGQDKLASDYADLGENGSGLIRLIVNILPAVCGLLYKNTLKKNYPDVEGEIILLIIAAIFSLFSLKNWIFSRIASYFGIIGVMFIPKLECIFSSNCKKMGRLLILILYFAYMCSLLLHGDGHLLPYKFIEF